MTEQQLKDLELAFINSVYHLSDPHATHLAILERLQQLRESNAGNAKTDNEPC